MIFRGMFFYCTLLVAADEPLVQKDTVSRVGSATPVRIAHAVQASP